MSLLKKAIQFAKLAQAPDPFLVDFAFETMEFDPSKFPGVSVDVAALQQAGKDFYAALVNKNPPVMLQATSTILKLTHDGGGELYNTAKQVFDKVKQMQPVQTVKVEPQISQPQYKLLDELMQLAQSSKNWIDFSPSARQQVKDEYKELSPQLEGMKQYLEFQDATVSTAKTSNDPGERNKALAKEKELAMFKYKMDSAIKTIESNLKDFAGMQRTVPLPDAEQSESALS